MEEVSGISSFVQKLNAAASGDLRGWRPAYVNDGGPTRYVLKDNDDRVYDAYVGADGIVSVYGPDMRVIA